MSEYLKNRLLSLQHDFRRSAVWSFQSLDRLIKNDLYFRHQARHSRQAQMPAAAVASASCLNPSEAGGTAAAAATRKRPAPGQEPLGAGSEDTPPRERDAYAMLFGRVDPRHIPESGSWWKGRQNELVSVSDDHEHGQMTSMVTVTQNDLAPELIAHARRGPCAVPTQEKKFAYLLTRRAPSDKRPNIQEDATAAVLFY